MGVRDEAMQSGALEVHIGLPGVEAVPTCTPNVGMLLCRFNCCKSKEHFVTKKVLSRRRGRKSELIAYYGGILLPQECNSVESAVP